MDGRHVKPAVQRFRIFNEALQSSSLTGCELLLQCIPESSLHLQALNSFVLVDVGSYWPFTMMKRAVKRYIAY